MPKIFQCGFSSFIYELFEEDGKYRATKTSIKTGTLCLEKLFDTEQEARDWLSARNQLDQKFIMAYRGLSDS